MRKLIALALSLTLLLGCFGLQLHAADDTTPFRVVCTHAGEDGKTIGLHWYTKADCGNVIKIDDAVMYIDAPANVLHQGSYAHRVTLSGFAAGPHTYDIDGVTGTFHINPGPDNDFSFIVTGDVQASSEADYAYGAAVHQAAWEQFPDAAFSVILGDHTNNSNNEEWDMFFQAFRPVLANGALVPIAGNHDGNLKWNWFRNMFTLKEPANYTSNMTGVYYSFDYGDAHIAVLNTNDMYPMSVMQRNWFLNDMMQSGAKWKLVFMHRAPYSAGNDGNLPDNIIMRNVLLPLFDKAGVDLVMYGHDHQYVRTMPMKGDKPVGDGTGIYTDPAGTLYLLPGAACPKRYPIHPNMLPAVRNAMALHTQIGKPFFTGITIEDDTLTYTAYTCDPANGDTEEYDHLSITKTTFPAPNPNYKPLPTDFLSTLPQQIWSFFTMVFRAVFVDYLFGLLPVAIRG